MFTLRPAVDVLSGVHALGGQEVLGVDSESVGVSELHLGERGSSSRIMNDRSHDSLDESVSFGIVVDSEGGRGDSVDAVSLVDALRVSFPLC